MNNIVNRAFVAEKKNYIQPAFEVMTVNTAYCVCQAAQSYTQGFDIDSAIPGQDDL